MSLRVHDNSLAHILPSSSIVAVHGINGDAHRTWTSSPGEICWLNNPDLLPKYIKNARILVWGYNANVTSLKGRNTSADRILQHAQTLIAQLQADREVHFFFLQSLPLAFPLLLLPSSLFLSVSTPAYHRLTMRSSKVQRNDR